MTRIPVTRIKAKLLAFDGKTLTLERISPSQTQTPDSPLKLSVLPQTKYVVQEKTDFAHIKPGDYAGAAVTARRGDRLSAQEVFVYAEALRGSGEGRFSEGERLLINGTVTQGVTAATLTLHYRGAVLNSAGSGKTVCEGRAAPPAYASVLACSADVAITVAPRTPVWAMTMAGPAALVPGALLNVAIATQADGRQVAPGVIVEKPQSSP